MYAEPDPLVTLDIEKAAAGGRMIARHEGRVVLVWGAIPGERVRARVERAGRGLLYADTVEVLDASPDRRLAEVDWRCGGHVLAHVAYERQLRLKGQILVDSFWRIAHVPLSWTPEVIGSPEGGYRMRVRLHARGDRLGFFREGSRELCDAAGTGQILPATAAWIDAAAALLHREQLAGLVGIELAENVLGDERACHLEVQGVEPSQFAHLADAGPLVGLSARRTDRAEVERLAGAPSVSDVIHARDGDPATALRLRRNVRAFFQANRFLLKRLVHHVVALTRLSDPIVDLYAGVGLFGLALAAAGAEQVTLVEVDPVSSADLRGNAAAFASRAQVERLSVESFLHSGPRMTRAAGKATFVVDPPRSGMSKEALRGVLRRQPARIVYVSCDAPTLARDTRGLLDGGYALDGLTGFDLFPNTAHVETVATFVRDFRASRKTGQPPTRSTGGTP
jgi:tRNA/tmRNA/rRNA uracil-C5-methylase (TrmA/RlmC/RlmD family)